MLAALLAACTAPQPDGPATSYPMAPERWALSPFVAWAGFQPPPGPSFARYEGMPGGTMTVADNAIAVSRDATFRTGTIDWDMKPLGYSDAGIVFRRQGTEAGEFVYLRANPDCPAADDCVQYVPIVRGLMPWNIYPDRQGPAPVVAAGWNHLHLVVADRKMELFVNREAVPSLAVAPLQALAGGSIGFKGPAIYANLVVRSRPIDDLPGIEPPRTAPGTVRTWWAAAPTVELVGRAPQPADIPRAGAWRRAASEATGLVDLGRLFGTAHAPSISTGWLRTVVTAASPTHRAMRIGWTGQLAVFVNGTRVFVGENQYNPTQGRLTPDGRLDPDDASVPLDLRRGRNEIVLAVGNGLRTSRGGFAATPYGWGAEAHLDDRAGLSFP